MTQTAARNQQCLMIEAEDRHYFTNEEHLPHLLEFCKSFDMKMSVVKAADPKITEFAELPKAVCDARKTPATSYDVVKKILPFDPKVCVPLVRTRAQIIEASKIFRDQIRDKFTKGEAASLEILESENPDITISSATFMQHVRTIRKELEANGYQFERISPGCYRSITPEQQVALEAEKKAKTVHEAWKKFKLILNTHTFTPTFTNWTPNPTTVWHNPNNQGALIADEWPTITVQDMTQAAQPGTFVVNNEGEATPNQPAQPNNPATFTVNNQGEATVAQAIKWNPWNPEVEINL